MFDLSTASASPIQPLSNAQSFFNSAVATRRLHLGCGNHILTGWTNIDIEPQLGAIGWNLAEPLPLPDGSIDFVFSEHFIEHVPLDAAFRLMQECKRVLAPGGAFRLSTPDLAYMIEQYRRKRLDEWLDVSWAPRSPCAMINEGMRAWGHQYVFDRDELRLFLQYAGFSKIQDAEWRKGGVEELTGLEIRPWHHEIIVEAWT